MAERCDGERWDWKESAAKCGGGKEGYIEVVYLWSGPLWREDLGLGSGVPPLRG